MSQYARDTDVSPERSRAEIENELKRFGATGFGYAWHQGSATIVFEFHNRRMRFVLPLPDPRDRAITHDAADRELRAPQVRARFEKEHRRRWRSLALSIKAKLITVADGISTVEDEFMAHIILPDGSTVGEWMTPQIASAYQNQKMPPLLEGPKK